MIQPGTIGKETPERLEPVAEACAGELVCPRLMREIGG